jgi:hypothetical protein
MFYQRFEEDAVHCKVDMVHMDACNNLAVVKSNIYIYKYIYIYIYNIHSTVPLHPTLPSKDVKEKKKPPFFLLFFGFLILFEAKQMH